MCYGRMGIGAQAQGRALSAAAGGPPSLPEEAAPHRGHRDHRQGPGVVSDTPGFSDSTSAKGFERIRKRVMGNLTAPFHDGPSPGPLCESNCRISRGENAS